MLNIAALQYTHEEAFINRWFGVWNRNALDIAISNGAIPMHYACIYFDVDGLKALNNVYGKVGSSAKIRQSCHRSKDLLFTAWSGDELCAFVPMADVIGLIDRLRADMADNGISATFAYSSLENGVYEVLDRLELKVSNQKDKGNKGGITYVSMLHS